MKDKETKSRRDKKYVSLLRNLLIILFLFELMLHVATWIFSKSLFKEYWESIYSTFVVLVFLLQLILIPNMFNNPKSGKKLINKLVIINIVCILVISIILATFNGFSYPKINLTSDITDGAVHKVEGVKGIIFRSGLTNEEERKLGIDGKYQIEIIPDQENEIGQSVEGFYLLGGSDLSDNIWECVEVEGTIPDKWYRIGQKGYHLNDTWTFDRSALNLDSFVALDLSDCISDFDYTTPINDEKADLVSVEGKVEFADNKLAPDVHFDLVFFSDEIEDTVDFQDEGGQKFLFIAAGTDEILREILDNIGREVLLEGYFETGFDDIQYLRVTKLLLVKK